MDIGGLYLAFITTNRNENYGASSSKKHHSHPLKACLQGFRNSPNIIINTPFDKQSSGEMFYPLFYPHDSNTISHD